jgi:hypothetical protein
VGRAKRQKPPWRDQGIGQVDSSEQQVSGCDSNAGMAVLAHELKMRDEQRGVNHVTKDTG